MRLLVAATLLGASLGLPGCGASPTDPYSNMQMLSPVEAGGSVEEEDPVLQEEKDFNSKFVHREKKKGR